MKRWGLVCVAVFLLSLGLSREASADNANSNIQTATQWCFGLVMPTTGGLEAANPLALTPRAPTNPPAIIKPLVQCFTSTDPANLGILPSVTNYFLTDAATVQYYTDLVRVMILLAIAWFGYRTTMGDLRRPKSETIILGLKIAGVVFYMSAIGAPVIYTALLNIIQQLSEIVSNTTSAAHTGGFCAQAIDTSGNGGTTGWQGNLWGRWDCIFGYLIGFTTTGFAATSMASFLSLMFFSMGAGILVFFVGLYVIVAILLGAFRFIHVYLICILALSFLFCIGYLFVPLLLFRNTFQYFNIWLRLVFGFVLTPILMFAFMGMMLVALDITLFSGSFSVFCSIGGSTYCGNNSGDHTTTTGGGYDLFNTMTKNISADVTNGGNANMQPNFMQMMVMALNGAPSLEITSGGPSETGATMSAASTTGLTGFIDTLQNMNASTYNAANHPMAKPVGLGMVSLNLSNVASGAGSTCTQTSVSGNAVNSSDYYFSNCPWVQNVLISLCVAALVAYVMLSLLSYIPILVSNLGSDLIKSDIASVGLSAIKSNIGGLQAAASSGANRLQSAGSSAFGMLRSVIGLQ